MESERRGCPESRYCEGVANGMGDAPLIGSGRTTCHRPRKQIAPPVRTEPPAGAGAAAGQLVPLSHECGCFLSCTLEPCLREQLRCLQLSIRIDPSLRFPRQPNRSLSIARAWRRNRKSRSNAGLRPWQARSRWRIARRSASSYGSNCMAYLYPAARITSFWNSSRQRRIFESSKYKKYRSCGLHAAALRGGKAAPGEITSAERVVYRTAVLKGCCAPGAAIDRATQSVFRDRPVWADAH
jgi:hypothetical protein